MEARTDGQQNNPAPAFQCRVCDLPDLPVTATRTGSRFSHQIRIYYCRRCGTRFTDPVPWDYSDWKEGGLDAVRYYAPTEQISKARVSRLLSFITARYGIQGALLDIGCGLGYSLEAARAMAWDVIGIEPNRTLASHGKETLGLPVIHDSFSTEHFAHQTFDLIILDQVLEHLFEPRRHFDQIVALLRPGGILWIGVPPVDWLRVFLARFPAFDKPDLGERWNMYADVEQHVNFFSRASIQSLVSTHPDVTLLSDYHRFRWSIPIHRMLGLSTGNFLVRKS